MIVKKYVCLVTSVLVLGCAHSRMTHVSRTVDVEELLLSGLLVDSVAWAGRGRLFDAESQLRKAQWLAPDNAAVRFNLAVVLGQQGKLSEAESLIQGLMQELGRRPDYILVLADINRQAGQLERARRLLKEAYGRYDDASNRREAAVLARSIANLAFVGGEEQEALCYSYEALRQRADSDQIGYHAMLLLSLNRTLESHAFIMEQVTAKRAVKESGFVQFVLALANLGIGDMESSLQAVKLSRQLSPARIAYGDELEALQLIVSENSGDATIVGEEAVQRREQLQSEVKKFLEQSTYSLLHWPISAQELLRKVVKDTHNVTPERSL